MQRRAVSKMQTLETRHPGFCHKVDAMLEQFWTTQDVKQLIQSHFGETVSLNTLARYKKEHRKAEQERMAKMNQAIGPSAEGR